MSDPAAALCRHISRWLLQLSKVTLQGTEAIDPERLELCAEMLARDFPRGAFTRDSLQAAATGHRYFPPYEDIRAALAALMPAPVPRDTDDGLTVLERSWVDYFHKGDCRGSAGQDVRPARPMTG